MIFIPNHCCICALAIREPDAYHEINKALLNATRPGREDLKRKMTGAKKLARQYEYLWPDKPDQSKEKKVDSLRKALTTHIAHIGTQIEQVRAEEKEHVKSLSDHAEEIITLCISAHKKAMLAAESKGEIRKDPTTGRQKAIGWEPKDFREATQTLFPASNLLSRLTPTANQDQGKSGLEEIRESIRAKRNDMANSSSGLQSG